MDKLVLIVIYFVTGYLYAFYLENVKIILKFP